MAHAEWTFPPALWEKSWVRFDLGIDPVGLWVCGGDLERRRRGEADRRRRGEAERRWLSE